MRLFHSQGGPVRFVPEHAPYRDGRGVEKANVILSSILVVSRLSGDYFSIMNMDPPNMSLQEQDLALFLDALEVELPGPAPNRANSHVVIALNPVAASVFNSKDGKTVLLGYRYQGTIFPLSIHFLSGEHETLFGHSTLLLDSYAGGPAILPIPKTTGAPGQAPIQIPGATNWTAPQHVLCNGKRCCMAQQVDRLRSSTG